MILQNGIQFQLSGAESPVALCQFPAMAVADPLTLAFINELSTQLMTNPASKPLPEVVALGFWLRAANINNLYRDFTHQRTGGLVKPVGCVVHYTPNNVDTMFMYSWVCSLLMGNLNIVRLGSSDSLAKTTILQHIAQLFEQSRFRDLACRNMFIQCDRTSPVNAQLSALADARVLWGGDESVQAIKQYPTGARCRDISFADRYSAALINANACEDEEQRKRCAALLWQDTKPYAQQACSSPKIIFWLGDMQQCALFADTLNQVALQQDLAHDNDAGQARANEHLVNSQLLQAQNKASEPLVNHRVCVLPVTTIDEDMLLQHSTDGLYYVLMVPDLAAVSEHLPERLQTLSYWGIETESLLKIMADPSIKGVDRCVSIGKALNFAPDWDGYRLFTLLSRYVAVDWNE